MSPDPNRPESLSVQAEIERARRIGTYGKIDRSAQYEGRANPNALLKSDNHLWVRMRKIEQRYHVWVPLFVVVTELVLEAAKFLFAWYLGR